VADRQTEQTDRNNYADKSSKLHADSSLAFACARYVMIE